MPESAASGFVKMAEALVGQPYEWKDISTMSGGTFTVPALTSAAVTRPGVIATPVENALVGMAKVHNAMHGSKPGCRADVGALRAVYRRGARAYNPKRHATVGRRRWAMQRVKAHLALLATGKRPHARYTRDDDLLPTQHPLAASSTGERKALLAVEGRRDVLEPAEALPVTALARDLAAKSAHAALTALEVKGVWDPDKHPRDHHGRFIHIGAAVNAMIDGRSQAGSVVGISRGNVRVRTADGTEHTVKAAAAEVTDHVGPHLSVGEQAVAHTDADRKARQLSAAGHPEAGAWQARADALAGSIKERVKGGESVHDPYVPSASLFADQRDLQTPEGLHAHLTSGAHGRANVPEFGKDEHAGFAAMHDRAHELGADHTHEPNTGPTSSPDAYAAYLNEQDPEGQWRVQPNKRHGGVDVVSGSRGNVGRSFDADGRDTGGAIGRLGGGPPKMPGDEPTRRDGSDWGTGYSPADPRTDPAYDRYVANLDAHLEAALTEVGGTDQVHDHVDGIDGAYQPDRQAAHDALLDELLAGYRDMPRERKAIMLAGPPGAGKSTTIKTHGHLFGVEADDRGTPTNYATVNPDDIKELMIKRGLVDPAYQRYGLGPQETASLIHEESSHIAKRLHRSLLSHGTNVIVDGTFSGRLDKNVGKINGLRSEGYSVTGVLVDGDIERSLINAGKRHRKGAEPTLDGPRLQGRYVPLGHIEAQRPTGQWSSYMQRPHRSQNAENFEAAHDAFNAGIMIFDNSTGESKLAYSEEPPMGETPPPAAALEGRHLDLLRNGTVGRRADSGDLPSMIAHALRTAAVEDRPAYLNPGYQGWQTAHAPAGNEHIVVTPAGHVTRVKRDVVTGQTARDVMPRPDVEKIVEHYVKPTRSRPTHTQLPAKRRRTPLENGAKVIHEDGRTGRVEHVPVSELRPGDDLIHPVTGAASGTVTDVRHGDGFAQTVDDRTPLGADRQVHVDGQMQGVKAPGARFARFRPDAGGDASARA